MNDLPEKWSKPNDSDPWKKKNSSSKNLNTNETPISLGKENEVSETVPPVSRVSGSVMPHGLNNSPSSSGMNNSTAEMMKKRINAYFEEDNDEYENDDKLNNLVSVIESDAQRVNIVSILIAVIILLCVIMTTLLFAFGDNKKNSGEIFDNGNNGEERMAPAVSETEQVVTESAVKTEQEADNRKVLTSEESKSKADKTSSKKEITDKEKFVNFIIENESLWLNQLRNSSMNRNNDECWFQDCDMDGFPEFICGDDVLGNKGFAHFYILKYNNGSALYDFNTGHISSKSGSSDFSLFLYRRGDKFVYVHEYSGTTYREEHGLVEYSGNWITDNSGDSVMYCIADANDNDSYDFDGLSRNEFIDRFYNYYSGMTPYKVSIKAVPCSKNSAYDNYSESEKRQKLLESFDAWGYSESSHDAVKAPLSDFIVELEEKSKNEKSEILNNVESNQKIEEISEEVEPLVPDPNAQNNTETQNNAVIEENHSDDQSGETNPTELYAEEVSEDNLNCDYFYNRYTNGSYVRFSVSTDVENFCVYTNRWSEKLLVSVYYHGTLEKGKTLIAGIYLNEFESGVISFIDNKGKRRYYCFEHSYKDGSLVFFEETQKWAEE